MSRGALALVLCCLTAGLYPAPGHGETLFWDGVPLDVSLRTGVERTALFPVSVREVRLPESVVAQLRTQSVGRAVHWRASADFDSVRVMVHTMGGGVYLLNLHASANGSVEPLRIHDPYAGTGADAGRQTGKPAELLLTRFAAQQLYAPERLLPAEQELRRYATGAYPQKIPLIRGVDFTYEILGGWRGYGLHITALRVTNHSSLRVPLDPRFLQHNRIRGDWRASTFHHRWLEPAGSGGEADTTVLYLVSDASFRRSLARALPPGEERSP